MKYAGHIALALAVLTVGVARADRQDVDAQFQKLLARLVAAGARWGDYLRRICYPSKRPNGQAGEISGQAGGRPVTSTRREASLFNLPGVAVYLVALGLFSASLQAAQGRESGVIDIPPVVAVG